MSTKETVFKTTNEWIINGDTGNSSESLLAAGSGFEKKGVFGGYSVPSDPSDLNRCIIFADNFPTIACSAFEKYKELGGDLERFADSYQRLAVSFINEAGYNWSKAKKAPKTYKLMKELVG